MTAWHYDKKLVKCSVDWCDTEAELKGMCRNHYQQMLRSRKK